MYRYLETDEYIYSIDVDLSSYKLTLLPMVCITLLSDNGFSIQVEIFNFIAVFVKIRKFPDEKIRNIVENLLK